MSDAEGGNTPLNDFDLPTEEQPIQPEEAPPIDTSGEKPSEPEEPVAETPEEEAEAEEKEGFLQKLAKANPYVVLLGVSLGAILLALLFLFMELAGYDFDIKAKKGKEGAMLMPPAVQSAPANTIAAA